MATEKQRLANWLNAQKSTGPKTDQGKAKSRRNALKHGLASEGVALAETEQQAYHSRLKHWTNDLKPQGDVERWLIESAVLASVRVDRCRRAEWAELSRIRRERLEAWEDGEQERLQDILPQDPGELGRVFFLIQESSTGCQWLTTQWKILHGAFSAQGYLDAGELDDLLCLLGLDRGKAGEPGTREQELTQMNERARGGEDDAAPAREKLGEVFEEHITLLERVAYTRWAGEEARWLNEDLDREAFDDTPRAILVRRYETASRNDVHRCLTQLARIRKESILQPQRPQFAYLSVQRPVETATPEPAPAAVDPIEDQLRNEPNPVGAVVGSSAVPATCASQLRPVAAPRGRSARHAEKERRRQQALELMRSISEP